MEDYVSVLRVHKALIATVTFLVMAVALGFSLLQTPTYESEAKILVEPTTVSPDEPPSPPNMETEKEVVRSTDVARIAARRLNYEGDLQALLDPLTVEVSTGSEVITLRYEHADPTAARNRAEAFGQAYLEFRRQRAEAELRASSEHLEAQLVHLRQRLRRTNAQIVGNTDPNREATLQAEADALIQQIALTRQQLDQLPTADVIPVGQVVDAPDRPTSPSRPNILLNMALALMVGLALAIGLAFLRERLRGRLRGAKEIEAFVGAPVLGMVPLEDSKWGSRGAHLAATNSAVSEAYRTLRTGLTLAAARNGTKTILVTSPNPGEGKTTLVANLGVSLARAKKSVILVSADVRRPTLHRFFDLPWKAGLFDVLKKSAKPAEALHATGIQGLRVLDTGLPSDHDGELLASEDMGNLLKDLRSKADFVLVDGAPILPVADTLGLVPFVDAVILIVDSKSTVRGAVVEAVQRLEHVDASIVGTVLNRFDPSQGRAYGYGGYGRGYARHRGEAAGDRLKKRARRATSKDPRSRR